MARAQERRLGAADVTMAIARRATSLLALGALLLSVGSASGEPGAPSGSWPAAAPNDPALRRALERHAARLGLAWQEYERRYGAPLGAWASRVLPPAAGETVFYPFSGPDFPTVHRLYPLASRYVLVAQQRAGRLPDWAAMSVTSLAHQLAALERSVAGFGRLGFFITDELERDERGARPEQGISSLLAWFAEREGFTLRAVVPLRIRDDGRELEVPAGDRDSPERWRSVRFELERRADGAPVQLDYVCLDLRDRALRADAAAARWLRSIAGHRVVLKAASHLLQKFGAFDLVRDALLERATSIVQDETGLAYARLSAAFQVELYGNFVGALERFEEAPLQLELARAYRRAGPLPALPFKFGYPNKAGSNLQVAVRRPAGQR